MRIVQSITLDASWKVHVKEQGEELEPSEPILQPVSVMASNYGGVILKVIYS